MHRVIILHYTSQWPAVLTLYYIYQAKNNESNKQKPFCSHRHDNVALIRPVLGGWSVLLAQVLSTLEPHPWNWQLIATTPFQLRICACAVQAWLWRNNASLSVVLWSLVLHRNYWCDCDYEFEFYSSTLEPAPRDKGWKLGDVVWLKKAWKGAYSIMRCVQSGLVPIVLVHMHTCDVSWVSIILSWLHTLSPLYMYCHKISAHS